MPGDLAQLRNQLIGQGVGAAISASQASKQYDRQKNMLTRGPTYARIGLEAAGFNPILALMGGRMPQPGKVPMPNMPSPGGMGDPKIDSAKKLMNLQGQAATAQAGASNAAATLSTSRAMALKGDIAKAQALSDYLNTDEGKAWVRRGFVHQSSPNTLGGFIGKAGAEAAPGLINKAKDWMNKNIVPKNFKEDWPQPGYIE